ncbi:putative aldouronate transport system substrate-binding protein [Paenibacillus sp. UNC496MF]|uniref:extracellular solute-binding protein n=1 Tax=Paenibacillus sp. UNC496MF TaxID=1502753 RepID=UPI0008EAC427|nr:extracellular solute-binding protein [Paenibacillus sp. UNC496MF]SFJ33116.1 putative aldouronate transport system substrate-binding protein [Paenibacillus sp. UNC496MF]
MRRKSAYMLAAAVLSAALLAGCGNNGGNAGNSGNAGNAGNSGSGSGNANANADAGSGNAAKQDVVTIKYVIPGTEPASWKEVRDAVNKKLLADGVNVQIDEQYIDWAAWDQKLNLMLSTGADFDMFQVMNDVVSLSNYIARGAVKDISAELNEYGSNIKTAISDDIFNAVTKDGKIYGIPANWMEPAVVDLFTSNDFLLKKYGIDSKVATPQEMLDAMAQLYDKAPAPKPQFPFTLSNVSATGMDFLHRTFDSFPFDVRDGIAMINNDGTVKDWVDTDEFKQESAFFRQAYEKKLINPDVLTLKQDQVQKEAGKMNWGFEMGTLANTQAALDKDLPGAKLGDFSLQEFNPEKGHYRFTNAKNLNVVAANSKHPDAVIQFLNWLYANQDNYDLFMYGIEGKTYKKTGDKSMEAILDPKTQASLIPNADWMIGNLNFIRVGDIVTATRKLYEPDKDAKNFISSGFFFDATPVKTELGNVKAVITSDIAPIYAGVVDYDGHIAQAQQKLKAAGVDKVIAEYQKQLDAYLAGAAK